jgi:metallo-beta-lactamase family protein
MTANQAKGYRLVEKTKKKLKNNKSKISFIGHSADNVTGSAYLVEHCGENILLDYGLVQTSNKLKQWQINNENFRFKVKDIKHIIVSHLNLDHFGAIPRLYANGCKANIYVYKGAIEYLRIAFQDGFKITTKDAEFLSQQYKKSFAMPYSEEDIDIALAHMIEVDDNYEIVLSDTSSFIYHPAYHIAGANQIELILKDHNVKKTILYTGDIGNINIDKPFLQDFDYVKKCDILIGESTYGGNPKSSTQKTREKDREKLKVSIRETCREKKGKFLIAGFAYQRVQELMYELYMLYKDDEYFDIPILIDSPLATNICKIFHDLIPKDDINLWYDIMNWDKFKFISEWEESYAAIKSGTPMIVIACSGFAENGRIRAWLQETVGSEKNTIAFVGYASEDSLAGVLKDGKKKIVEIDGMAIKNKIKVLNLLSFSSHMQNEQLLEYYSDINCKQAFLIHGNKKSQYEFAQSLQDEYVKKLKSTKVFIPLLNDIIEI